MQSVIMKCWSLLLQKMRGMSRSSDLRSPMDWFPGRIYFLSGTESFEISSGTGAIVIGLASVIIGTSLFKNFSFLKTTTAVLIGSIIYKACVAATLKFFEPQDMKLITAVLFLLILVIGRDRKKKVKKKCLN